MNKEEQVMDVDLLCILCGVETAHRLRYQSDRLQSVECLECHRKLIIGEVSDEETGHTDQISHHDMHRLYQHHFLNRVLNKPHRMSEEVRNDLTTFVVTIPLRVVTKPYRLLMEILKTHDDS